MIKKKVFVSFDFENDKQYKYILEAWNKSDKFDFQIDDKSSTEINSWNIGIVKACLTKKIKEADYTLVIVGKEANKKHKDYNLIGYTNWQNFEVVRSLENGNKMIGIKLDRTYSAPEELYGVNASWVNSFNLSDIVEALGKI